MEYDFYGNRKYREITIIVPNKRFERLPDKIEYKDASFGRMEKAWRLLIRSMKSAIDNGNNHKNYSELREQYYEKGEIAKRLRDKLYNLRKDADQLRLSIQKFGLKIEGCSIITQEIKKSEIELNEIEKEMKIIEQQVPKWAWTKMYWW